MTERGLPIVGGAPACPFVAFEDDRDERATSPDHRHRCYAEAQPAPRALAHQEAYCLSSAFPVCPTFQDWARREAARARPADIPPERDEADADEGFPPLIDDRPPRRGDRGQWAAPPPWLRGAGPAGQPIEAEPSEPEPADQAGAVGAFGAGAAGGGLSGSFADRMLSDQAPLPPARQPAPAQQPQRSAPPAPWDGEPPARDLGRGPADDGEVDDEDLEDDEERAAAPVRPPRRRERSEAGSDRAGAMREPDIGAPSWERPRRLEAYPTLRSHRWSSSLPTIALGLVALLIAAAALLFVPQFLSGLTGAPGAASPTPTSAASVLPGGESAAPSEIAPAATPFLYTVQANDNMFKIAKKFGVDFNALVAANKATHPNPDVLNVGDVLIIPTVLPSELPGASPAASP